jgi:hypothetical protein
MDRPRDRRARPARRPAGGGRRTPFGGAGVGAPAVPRAWPGATVVCLGGGPSLTADDVTYCRGKARVIAVNDAHRLAPWADALYAADAKWWNYHGGVPTFTGPKYGLQGTAHGLKPALAAGITILENTGDSGLEVDPRGVRTGKNSGYQAINVAVHFGASRILLLGYDMHAPNQASSHWFGQHPSELRAYSPYDAFLHLFASMPEPLQVLGVEVINCTPGSALTVFPLQPLREALGASEAAA